jgi:hypothetical protein
MSQYWCSYRPKMEVVTYGCVTSVEAGREAQESMLVVWQA